jgi:8-oxo-dGTP diphosphatase
MIEVVAAVVKRADGRVLVARRTRPAAVAGLWEFPGGKVEPGETPEASLARELCEELAYRVVVGEWLGEAIRDDADAALRLTAYAARPADGAGEPELVDGTHDRLRWVSGDELATLDLAPLDVPLVPGVLRFIERP